MPALPSVSVCIPVYRGEEFLAETEPARFDPNEWGARLQGAASGASRLGD